MKILKAIWSGLEYFGRARAAGYMARQGDGKGAVALMDRK